MKTKILVIGAIAGIILAIGVAYELSLKPKPLPPAFQPASNPYSDGIYAQGIVESMQANGSNISVYPEVSGVVSHIAIKEGQDVSAGTVLLTIEDSIQRATALQAKAQVSVAVASAKAAEDAFLKIKSSLSLNAQSVSKDAYDRALNALKIAQANVDLANRQYESANVILAKYQIKAQSNVKVLSINAAVGSYISSQGVYDSYTQQNQPIFTLGESSGNALAVRCYVDEVLLQRLPQSGSIQATMSIRGSNIKVPLKFVRLQPNVSPKIELSNQRAERVDVRVLPVLFTFDQQKDITTYPGQLVDVYIGKVADDAKH